MPRQYWLMKCEPEAYTIQDLARDGVCSWEGVRNYQARNFMRDQMQVGDGVLFYASQRRSVGRHRPGRGLARRLSRSHRVEEGARVLRRGQHQGQAALVHGRHLKFVEAFPAIVPLDVLKTTKGLEDMMVTRKGARLSVQPVKKAEFDIVAEAWAPEVPRLVLMFPDLRAFLDQLQARRRPGDRRCRGRRQSGGRRDPPARHRRGRAGAALHERARQGLSAGHQPVRHASPRGAGVWDAAAAR